MPRKRKSTASDAPLAPVPSEILDQFVGQINMTRYPWIVRSPGVTGTGRFDRT